MAPILITTFAPWRAHQPSNASDDLIAHLHQQGRFSADIVLMRQIPVNFQLAPCQVIAKIVELRPRLVICCGMAEDRTHLTLERNGQRHQQVLQTSLNFSALLSKTYLSAISHDAGDYVCNHLYYEVLSFLEGNPVGAQGLFIHVPRLTARNQALLMTDFCLILEQLRLATVPSAATVLQDHLLRASSLRLSLAA